MAQHHFQLYRLVGYLSLVSLLTACSIHPAPMIIPNPDQQNGATRGHGHEKETN